MKLAILLTATIQPLCNGARFTTEQRAKMYRDTLRFYAREIGRTHPIVFLENSNYDLTPMKHEFADSLDIEWLQYAPTWAARGLSFNQLCGNGYNEYVMIAAGVSDSKTLNCCTHFLKITGRYAMLNIHRIIREIEQRAENSLFMCDMKDSWVLNLKKNTWHFAESRYWVAGVAFYRAEMLDIYRRMDWRRWQMAEFELFGFCMTHRNNPRFIFRFRTQARFNGIQSGKDYNDPHPERWQQDSWCNSRKDDIRQLLRWLFPHWWI